jgi:hypothetical protein
VSLDDYEFVDPQGTGVGAELQEFADSHPVRAARLVDWLESCIANEASRERCFTDGKVDVYLVPPRFVLANLPDAAALVRVDHLTRKIDLIKIIAVYGGYNEAAEWEQVKKLAAKARKG